jgi:hypothetical protein
MIARNVIQKIIVSIVITSAIGFSHTVAVETSIWETETTTDFEKGNPADVSIRSDGHVVLSSTLELMYDTEELYVWSLAEDSQGNLYVGTGNDGKIFKVSGDGQGALFFDSSELEILSLVTDAQGNLYAGTAPRGIIYKINAKGEATTFVETGESYVWALAFDSQGDLYAGTGDQGKIFRVTPQGESTIVYDSNETHMMTLAFDRQNNLFAGSEGNGIVYRLSPDGDVFVLYDAPQKEIHSLHVSPNGTIYAGATEAVVYVTKAPAQRDRAPQENDSDESTSEAKPSESVHVGKEKSVVYEISPDGIVTKVWSSSFLLLSLIARDDQSLLIGTGDDGKLYSVLTDRTSLSLTKSSESQILSILRDHRGRALLGTGNMGKIFRLTSNFVEEGSLESNVYDTETISKWGKISWEASIPSGTSVSFATRSGNSEYPDDTWSDWSQEYGDAGGAITSSPPARFLQWRAKLKTTDHSHTPVLKKVSVAFLQHNLSPEISEVAVLPPGKKAGRSLSRIPSKPNDGSSSSKSNTGLRTVEWKAIDPNNDQLSFALHFRGLDERTWKKMSEDETGTSYSWDTESIPDGPYVIKVVASDRPSNPPSSALTAEKESWPFIVDNTPPRVYDIKASQGSPAEHLITGQAEDVASIIASAEYSIDAGDWMLVFPKDEIFDSKREGFSFTVRSLPSGEHTLVIRAIDDAGNTGAGKVVFTVK